MPSPFALGLFAAVALVDALAPSARAATDPIHKIQHVVVIMQENRSFDSYFGTFPGADGIPMQNGVPTVCVPDPKSDTCVRPFHDPADMNAGGPHTARNAVDDVDGGRMDGFIRAVRDAQHNCLDPNDPKCVGRRDGFGVMGYHDAHEIPNYWRYAQEFVLQDRMFEPTASWSLPAHLFLVSGWSATCRDHDPMRCVSDLRNPGGIRLRRRSERVILHQPNYAWTDLTYLLHAASVSWKYYVAEGTEPDCDDDEMTCEPKAQSVGTPGIWNPLP